MAFAKSKTATKSPVDELISMIRIPEVFAGIFSMIAFDFVNSSFPKKPLRTILTLDVESSFSLATIKEKAINKKNRRIFFIIGVTLLGETLTQVYTEININDNQKIPI